MTSFEGPANSTLLRNLSKGRGVGFFEAGNFHPDFILWLVEEGRQQVIFVDPKGIRNFGPRRSQNPVPRDHQGHRTTLGRSERGVAVLHRIEHAVQDDAAGSGSITKSEMRERNILFQDEDKDSYIKTMLDR